MAAFFELWKKWMIEPNPPAADTAPPLEKAGWGDFRCLYGYSCWVWTKNTVFQPCLWITPQKLRGTTHTTRAVKGKTINIKLL